jgi:hypothetical protein
MALTFNLPSQIVVQTAAQWAADGTVYSNKRILVTSDANWDSSDQRKFKIADGVQTWSNLDYPPIGYETMTTNAGEFKFAKTIAGAVLLWTNGQDMRFSAAVGGSPAFILKTDGTIVLENGTVNKFLKLGASKEITFVDSPVSQTITNGVTDKAPSEDAVFDALALKLAKCHTLSMAHSSLNPADSTSYFFAANAATASTSTNVLRRKPAGITGNIYSVTMQVTIGTSVGTSENSTFKINNVTQGTSVTVSSTIAYTAVGIGYQWDLASPLAVTKGDLIECRIDMPAFATNPVAVIHYVDLIIYGF